MARCCGRAIFSKGLCSACYMRAWRKNQTKDIPVSENRRGPKPTSQRSVSAGVELTAARSAYANAVGVEARLRWGNRVRELEEVTR